VGDEGRNRLPLGKNFHSGDKILIGELTD